MEDLWAWVIVVGFGCFYLTVYVWTEVLAHRYAKESGWRD